MNSFKNGITVTAAFFLTVISGFLLIPAFSSWCPLAAVEFEQSAFGLLLAQRGLEAYTAPSEAYSPLGYYGPLFYLPSAALAHLFHLQDAPYAYLLLFRLTTWLFVPLSLTLLFHILHKSSGNLFFAFSACFVLLAKPWLHEGIRPDFAALFFVILAWHVFHSGTAKSRVRDFLTGVLLSIAFLHLQRTAALFLSILFFLVFYKKDFRRAVDVILGFLLCMTAVMTPLWILTQGRVAEHMFVFMSYAGEIRSDYFSVFVRSGKLFYGFSACAIAGWFLLRKNGEDSARLLKLYFIVTLLLTLYTVRPAGAAGNHFLEILFCGLLVLAQSLRGRVFFQRLAVFFFSLFLVKAFYSTAIVAKQPDFLRVEKGTCGFESEMLKIPEGPMLSDYSILPYKMGRAQDAVNSFEKVAVLGARGKFSLGKISEGIQNRKYASVLLSGRPHFKEMFFEDIQKYYRKAFQVGNVEVWTPQALSSSTSERPQP